MMIFFGSKGPILSLILAPTLYYLFYFRISLKKVLIISFVLLGFGFLLFYPDIILKAIPPQYQDYFEYRYFNFEGFKNDRPTLYKMAIIDIDQRSLFFGKGTGNFGYLYLKEDSQVYPHNIFIEILYENGLIGIILFMLILIPGFIKIIKQSQFNNKINFLFVVFLYFLINAQFSGDLGINFGVFMFIFLLSKNIE